MKTGSGFLFIITVFLFFLLSSAPLFSGGDKEENLTIFYTSSLNGNLDGCECVSHPRSGLVKSAVFLRSRDRTGSILLDTGDLFDVYKDLHLSGYILESFEDLGYDAVGIGDQEFSNGIPALLEYKNAYPLLSNNLFILNEGKETVFTSDPVIKSAGDSKIGIISLIDPDVFFFYPDEIKNNIFVESVSRAASRLTGILKESGVSIVVAIYHGPESGAETLAAEVEGLDVILLGHEQKLIDARKSGDSILVSAGPDGNRVGILKLTASAGSVTDFENDFLLFDYFTDPDDPAVRERIDQYKDKLKLKVYDGNK